MHIDVNVNTRGTPLADRRAGVDAAVTRLEAAGATKTKVVDREDHYWVEMDDPEGNRFCVQ